MLPVLYLYFGFPVVQLPEEGKFKPYDLDNWMQAYFDRSGVSDRDGQHRLLGASPAELVRDGSGQWNLMIMGSITASPLRSTEVMLDMLKVPDHQHTRVIQFCKRMGIEWREPKWYLACSPGLLQSSEPELAQGEQPPKGPGTSDTSGPTAPVSGQASTAEPGGEANLGESTAPADSKPEIEYTEDELEAMTKPAQPTEAHPDLDPVVKPDFMIDPNKSYDDVP